MFILADIDVFGISSLTSC